MECNSWYRVIKGKRQLSKYIAETFYFGENKTMSETNNALKQNEEYYRRLVQDANQRLFKALVDEARKVQSLV